jgi:hypothetical protein
MRISTSSGLTAALFFLSQLRHDYFCAKFVAKLLKPDTAYAGKQMAYVTTGWKNKKAPVIHPCFCVELRAISSQNVSQTMISRPFYDQHWMACNKGLKAVLQRSLPFIYQYFRTNNFNLRNAS